MISLEQQLSSKLSLESQSTAWLLAFTVGHLQTHGSQAKHMIQTHTHRHKNPLTKNQKYEYESWAHNFEKSWETNSPETTIRTSLQLSPKHRNTRGEKNSSVYLKEMRRLFAPAFRSSFLESFSGRF